MKQDWKIKQLGEVCEVFNGSTPLRRKKEYWENGTINWFTISDIRKQGRTITNTEQKITEDGFKSTSMTLLPKDTVLLCCTASVGEFAITNIELTTNQQFNGLVIKDKNQLSSKYLFYFSSTLKDKLLSVSGKTTIDFVSMTKVKNIQILLPPLPEQQRIVAILDKAFPTIDKAKANAEQNLKNAKELFMSYLQGVFENKSDDWEEKSLKDVVTDRCSLSYGIVQPGNDFENGLAVIRPVDLKGKFVKKDKVKLINPQNAEKYKRTMLQGDELLLCVRGDTGVISLITDDFYGANVTRGIVPISFKDNVISLQFGYYSFISPFLQKQIKDKTYGAALMQINIRDVRQLLIRIPPIKEQKQIVQQLDQLQVKTKKLEAIYQQKIDDLDELKKSILEKAFNGELETEKELAL